MNPWLSENVIVGNKGIAVVEELAGDWLGALSSGGNSRCFRH